MRPLSALYPQYFANYQKLTDLNFHAKPEISQKTQRNGENVKYEETAWNAKIAEKRENVKLTENAKIWRSLKINETFAIYRVEAPYKPITNHGQGKRMGGGKGAISEYGTPVRAGRIIVEVGGNALWSEVQPWLSRIAGKMPFDALAVNKEMLDSIRAEEQKLVETNQNPISFEWLVRNNMLDCQRKLSTYDKIWFGKFAYLDRHLNKKFQWVTGPRYKGKR